jgi:hypothetical protein
VLKSTVGPPVARLCFTSPPGSLKDISPSQGQSEVLFKGCTQFLSRAGKFLVFHAQIESWFKGTIWLLYLRIPLRGPASSIKSATVQHQMTITIPDKIVCDPVCRVIIAANGRFMMSLGRQGIHD